LILGPREDRDAVVERPRGIVRAASLSLSWQAWRSLDRHFHGPGIAGGPTAIIYALRFSAHEAQ
jgi:hypothetical protein